MKTQTLPPRSRSRRTSSASPRLPKLPGSSRRPLITFAFCLITSALSLLPSALFSQAPSSFNYQAVARSNGEILKNTTLDVRLSILQGSETGTSVWTETQTVTTNDLGLFTLQAGSKTPVEVDWSAGPYYLQVEVDLQDGNGFQAMGTAQLLSVPYALYARDVANKDDADADPQNEIQDLQLNGNLLSLTLKGDPTVIDLGNYIDDADADPQNEIQDLQLNGNILTITKNGSATEIDLSPYLDNPGWNKSGDTLTYAGSVGIGTETVQGSRLSVRGDDLNSEAPLFEVKRKDGQPVFSVYNDSVVVHVNDATAKGPRGGFIIGGFGPDKGGGRDYLRVTPDSVRIYLDQTQTKGPRGGFAIGGFGPAKGTVQEYLRVTPDSTRVYINDQAKGPRGGFAIGGFGPAKGIGQNYFNVSGSASAEVINGENRVLWYPRKNAFLTGQVKIEHPDSIGSNSFASGYEAKAKGEYSQALGYKPIARGNFSTAIGREAVAEGVNSFAFGQGSRANKNESYAIGREAIADGYRSFAFGSAGVDSAGNPTGVAHAIGDYSFAIGQGAVANNIGSVSIGLGNHSTGKYSLATGYKTFSEGYSSTTFGSFNHAYGDYSISGGVSSDAYGPAAVAIGNDVEACYGATVVGRWNQRIGSHTQWISTDPIFVVGNGTPWAKADAFTVLKNGNVKISSIFPNSVDRNAKLYVEMRWGTKTSPSSVKGLFIRDGLYNNGNCIDVQSNNGSSYFVVDENGKVGIGVSNPGTKLAISGLTGTTSGSYLRIYNNNIYYYSSSRETKLNIRPLKEDFKKILKAQPVMFKDKISGEDNIGYIAEDFDSLGLQNLVIYENGKPKSLSYELVSLYNLEIIKTQQQAIANLKRELNNLKKENAELAVLKEKIRKLEAIVGAMAGKL